MDSHDHALMWPLPHLQGRSRRQRALGIDHAGADLGQGPAQRIPKERLVPVPVPGHARCSTASFQREPEAEDRYGKRAAPRERRDECGGRAAFLEV